MKRAMPAGIVYICPQCEGRDVAVPVLRKVGATDHFLRQVWLAVKDENTSRILRCPHCNLPMAQVTVGAGGHELVIDVCSHCRAIWFDHGELRCLPRDRRPQAPERLSEKAREQMALLQLQTAEEERQADDPAERAPPEWWKWLPGIFGLPVEYETPALRAKPWLTWSVAAVLVLAFAATAWDLEGVVKEWGFVPALWYRHGGLTLVTAFFLHGGALHLLSNVYFLLVFGDNVEDRLGPLWFLALLVAADLAGNFLHGVLEPRSSIPCIGASGGLAGLLGFYGVAFPLVRLGLFMGIGWIRLPAIAMLGLFLFIEFAGAWQQISGFSEVSSLAHLGGMAVGVMAAIVVRVAGDRPMDFQTPVLEPPAKNRGDR